MQAQSAMVILTGSLLMGPEVCSRFWQIQQFLLFLLTQVLKSLTPGNLFDNVVVVSQPVSKSSLQAPHWKYGVAVNPVQAVNFRKAGFSADCFVALNLLGFVGQNNGRQDTRRLLREIPSDVRWQAKIPPTKRNRKNGRKTLQNSSSWRHASR